MLQVYVFLLAD